MAIHLLNGCFNWMTPNQYMKNEHFTKLTSMQNWLRGVEVVIVEKENSICLEALYVVGLPGS